MYYLLLLPSSSLFFFFFNDTATTEIYTLSLHDALPIFQRPIRHANRVPAFAHRDGIPDRKDRKSTRLNSSYGSISYAVFCLKKKKKKKNLMTKKRVLRDSLRPARRV